MKTLGFLHQQRVPQKAVRWALWRHGEQGIALITSLLILVVISLVAVSMYRSSGLQEKITGNTLEKQRALQAADSALRYGEWWLGQGNTGSGSVCSGVINGNTEASIKICSTALVNAATLPWSNRIDYQPPSMTVAAGGGLNASLTGILGDVNYATSPSLFISYMGLGPDGKSTLYQLTGAGYGGSTTSASVVQSVYSITYRINDIGGL